MTGSSIGSTAVRKCNAKLAAQDDFTGEIVTLAIAVCCTGIGMIVHGANLDFDPAMRSFAFAFCGANITVGWKLWAAGEDDWLEFVPVLAVVVVAGLVLGLLMSEGDVQKETRARWQREAQGKQSKASNSSKDANDEKKPRD